METFDYEIESDFLWDGMTANEVKDLIDLVVAPLGHTTTLNNELWDGMTTDEVIDAIACAEIKVKVSQ